VALVFFYGNRRKEQQTVQTPMYSNVTSHTNETLQVENIEFEVGLYSQDSMADYEATTRRKEPTIEETVYQELGYNLYEEYRK